MFDYDLLVIGAGSAGLAAAQAAARYGTRVAIADPNYLGGTCVNRGCIPKKFMVFAADFARQQCLAKSYGWVNPSGQFDWLALRTAIDQQLAELRQSYQSKLAKAGVTVLHSSAQFVDPHQLTVGDRTVTADNVIIATGAEPVKPDLPGIDCGLTSRDMFRLETLPEQLTIVGGGYIGAEFSDVFATLGCQVTLIDKNELILPGFDHDIRQTLHQSLIDQGIRLMPETALESIKPDQSGLHVSLSGKCEDTLLADTLLLALGRSPNMTGLNLEAAGVKVEDGAIAVDDYSRTSQPSIFAIGDCTDRLPLTPVARAEGAAAAKTLFTDQPQAVSYRWVPSAVFCSPQAATVGYSEAEARAHTDLDIEVHCSRFTPLRYQLSPQDHKAMIKLVVNARSQEILGLHIVGDNASEIIQGFIPALRRGLTTAELADTIGLHPTSAEEVFGLV
ncbi:glutathione-disulfide reductase [Nodosilinea sp. E11]|uniref:glutathione-disulfide reductase n=1 Tax=Nodosilinea sp. E11 TaxID=3037479 RepID=UPI002934BBFD|nr:glutathione-disulfide reductase [Nodosilinea sp. E11]WOD40159.1 glutathione-disulfide reductase [Nodosilinea sp. E11]